ncbi:hypothetical protein OIU35_19270 [Boseaceae bacterium BT-24-1]|nr:hypothetical protein [Boseaceae bacterium BT-24-1]
MKTMSLFAMMFCLLAGHAHSQSNAVDVIVGNFVTRKAKIQSAKDVHPGYFNLKIGENSCQRTEDLIGQASGQIRPRWLCPISSLGCPVEGSYSVSSAVEVAFRGFGGAPVKAKTALFVAGSELPGKTEQLECNRVLASGVRANEVIDIRFEAAGSLKPLDPKKLAVFLVDVVRIAGLAVSIARPTLGGQIVSGERRVEIEGQTKSVTAWIQDIETRGKAVSELLRLIAAANNDSVKKRPVLSLTPRDDGLNIAFDDSSRFELKKDYFWTLLLPKWSQAQDVFRFEPRDLRSGNIDSDLKGHIGLDTNSLVRSIDVKLEAGMSSQDPATVARACRDLLNGLAPLVRRQDALGITWHVAYKLQPETSTARCFGKEEVAELIAFGLSAPPYPAAYGATQVAERQP